MRRSIKAPRRIYVVAHIRRTSCTRRSRLNIELLGAHNTRSEPNLPSENKQAPTRSGVDACIRPCADTTWHILVDCNLLGNEALKGRTLTDNYLVLWMPDGFQLRGPLHFDDILRRIDRESARPMFDRILSRRLVSIL